MTKHITHSQIEEAISVLEDRAFTRGVGMALSEVYAANGDIKAAAFAMGFTLKQYIEHGGEAYDLERLKAVGIPAKPKPRKHYAKKGRK